MKFDACFWQQFWGLWQHNLSPARQQQLLGDKLLTERTEWRKTTQEQRLASAAVLHKAQRWAGLIGRLPSVAGVLLCNSAALGTATAGSDIDVLIVTRAGRIWTARAWCTAVLHLLRLRRHGNKIAGRFCLSFFVDERALDFSQIAIGKYDPYLAAWTATLRPLHGERVAADIFQKNQKLLQRHKLRAEWLSGDKQTDKKLRKPTTVGNWLEDLLHRWLRPRSEHKRALLADARGTIISDQYLKFHDRDVRWEVAEKMRSRL